MIYLGHVTVAVFVGWVFGTFMTVIAPPVGIIAAAVGGCFGKEALDCLADAVKKSTT